MGVKSYRVPGTSDPADIDWEFTGWGAGDRWTARWGDEWRGMRLHFDFTFRPCDGRPGWSDQSREVVVPFYLLALITSTLPAVRLAQFARDKARRPRRHQGLCPACGYDLHASPDRCPECGAVPAAKEKEVV
jgi:hypothetical protein